MEGSTSGGGKKSSQDRVSSDNMSYEDVMGISASSLESGGGASALTSRLVRFREWLQSEAKAVVHPSVCVVNGEATDGTKNAPVLTFGPPIPTAASGSTSGAATAGTGRCGAVDRELDQALYDRTIGCQVRVVREMKKEDVSMTIPRGAMVTPDLVACSDAGRAVLACCESRGGGFWDAFENTVVCEKNFADKIVRNSGTQLLVKILQERKKAETAISKSEREQKNGEYKQAQYGKVSTRAPLLAFLVHQRFSNEVSPAVAAKTTETGDVDRRIFKPAESPNTFAPYARTLPSVVPLPFCWKRNELALLAGCIPGVAPLQEVASRTFQLVSEFLALVEAGICRRFPDTFPPGLITWERWVWAASVFTSRALPVSCYLNEGEQSAAEHVQANDLLLQSPPEVWDELGVMIPLLDMLNHEGETSQVTWKPSTPIKDGAANGTATASGDSQTAVAPSSVTYRPPQAVVNRRVKKGSQVYCSYGQLSNHNLMLQYGFAQINNPMDEVKIGWGMMDAIGNVEAPSDYVPIVVSEDGNETSPGGGSSKSSRGLVYESSDPACMDKWWSEDRISLLEKEALLSDSFILSLKAGKKMTAAVFNNGAYHPILLTVAVIGTMPADNVGKQASREQGTSLVISKRHQAILRCYLAFVFTRKLEKLLQNLNTGLKDHFNNVQLWTKATHGCLTYVNEQNEDHAHIGWQTFFDQHAYAATMELERKYYAVGPDSCVLALYDGHLRSLQQSLDGLSTQEKFEKGVLRQLSELGFLIGTDDDEESVADGEVPSEKALLDAKEQQSTSPGKGGGGEKSSRRRNRKKGDRPSALKLHIGNLAYTTKPAVLFDFFGGLYGRENILECHIPTERGSGRSRGFGFVTMPESVAMKALESGQKHEIGGRLLKVAPSNSAGAGKTNSKVSAPPVSVPSDRCETCGYRPKYCTCPAPKISGHNGSSNRRGDGSKHPPPMDPMGPYGHYGRDSDVGYYGSTSGSLRQGRRRSYSRSPSPHRRGSSRSNRDDRDRLEHDYGYREYRRRRSRSRSMSFGHERDRGRGGRDRSRDKRKSRDSAGSGSRSCRGGSLGWDRRMSRDRSPSAGRSRSDAPHSRIDRKSTSAERPVGSRERGPSDSVSPPRSRSSKREPGSVRKREGHYKRRNRSRSRGRSGRSKRRRHARSRSRSVSRSHSRSLRKE